MTSKLSLKDKSQRIGILGGTFDPIHAGHLTLAEIVREKMKLNKIIFVPTGQPPHKRIKGIMPARDRLNMVKLAVEGNSAFDVSSFEVDKEGKSYSFETVEHFGKVFPKAEIFFVVGADALRTLPTWRNFPEIKKRAKFIAVNRPGNRLSKTSSVKYNSVEMPGVDISSSYIRGRIIQGESVRYLVPEKVNAYILKHKLYQKH